jgi:hypothetical protein
MSTTDWKQVGRNDPCPCGSGKKYKHCHMQADREAAQQAEIEAAQRAEEERLAELRERAEAQRPEESALALSDGFDDEAGEGEGNPNIEYLDHLWEMFEQAEGDRKWEICETGIDDQMMDGEEVFEFFIVLHRDALERGLERRFVQLVAQLRDQCFDAYQEEIANLFQWTFPFLSPSERDTFLPDFIQDLIVDGPNKVEPFLNAVDMLAILGESAVYTQVVRATQEAVESAGLFEWAIDGYHAQYLDTYLFEYLDNTPPDERQNAKNIADFIASLPNPEDIVEEEYEAYLRRLAGERSAWTLADFPVRTSGRTDARIPETTVEHLVQLSQEFLAHLHWEKGIPFVKGELATKELRRFLANQEISAPARKSKGKKGRNAPTEPIPAAVLPLCPDREQLDRSLYSVMSFFGYQPYKGLAVMEIIPAWLQFLEERGLIDSEAHAASRRSLGDLAEQVQIYAKNEALGPQLIENLALAWAKSVEE